MTVHEMMNEADQTQFDVNAVIASILPSNDQKYFSGELTSYDGANPNMHIRRPGEPSRGMFDTSITFVEPNDPAWSARRNLLTALVNRAVRSASLVPASREQNQTLYVGKLSNPGEQYPMWAVLTDEEFERRLNSPPNTKSTPIIDMIEGEIPGVDREVKRINLEGFVQPYEGIEFNAIRSESPFEARRVNVLSEPASEFVTDVAREKFTEICELFKTDPQSRELALALVDGE